MVFWATGPKKPQRQALKNWTTGNGLLGTVIMNIKRDAWPCLRISPDRKWIAFSAHDYIYLLDETDKLKDPQGNPVPFRVGDDFLRISWRDGDPLKGIDYQYLLRRVAYKDAQYGHSDFYIYIYTCFSDICPWLFTNQKNFADHRQLFLCFPVWRIWLLFSHQKSVAGCLNDGEN